MSQVAGPATREDDARSMENNMGVAGSRRLNNLAEERSSHESGISWQAETGSSDRETFRWQTVDAQSSRRATGFALDS